MDNKYNSWCKWHPLKAVMLGRTYYPEFYRDVKNSRIRDCMIRIAEETEEDFLYYKEVLEEFGATVIRPELDINDSIMNNIDYGKDGTDTGKISIIPRPPAQPRDGQLVMGNDLVYNCCDHYSISQALNQYNRKDAFFLNKLVENISILRSEYNDTNDITFHEFVKNSRFFGYDPIFPEEWGKSTFNAPAITCVGKRVYVDVKEVSMEDFYMFENLYPERDFIQVKIGGHSDGCFHTLKEGVILSLSRYTDYEETFTNWDVCYLPNQSWSKVQPFLELKKFNRGKWWLPGEEENHEFTNFVETWLQDWVGYVEETVFDVNVLMLDDKHVCVNNYNKIVFDYLKKHDIEPIIVPFRHRYFWDGGLHCITLDLYREGSMEDYFNGRSKI